MKRDLIVWCLAVTVAWLTGCAMRVEPAAEGRGLAVTTAAPGPPVAWPARADLRRFEFRTPWPPADGDEHVEVSPAPRAVEHAKVFGDGLVTWKSRESTGRGGVTQLPNPPTIASVCVLTTKALDRASATLDSVPVEPEQTLADMQMRAYILSNIARAAITFRIQRPADTPDGSRGLVLVMHGLGGKEYSRSIADTLVAHGWVVIDNVRSSISTYDAEDHGATEPDPSARGKKALAERFSTNESWLTAVAP
jgi:hypothetical protein